MDLLLQIALGLIPAVLAFIAGVLWKRMRMAAMYVRARRFWRPVMTDDLQFVLGGFGELQDFEASGIVGRGDVLAMDELVSYFQRIGYGKPSVVYADQLGRYDLSGDSFRTNMIIIGGPDANSMTREMVNRVKLGIGFMLLEDGAPELKSASRFKWIQRNLSFRRLGGIAVPWKARHGWQTPALEDVTQRRISHDPKLYRPALKGDRIVRDYGVIIKAPNPFDESKNIIILCGTYGYGTWAAVRYAQSDKFLTRLASIPRDAQGIECIISVEVVRESPQNLRLEFLRESPKEEQT